MLPDVGPYTLAGQQKGQVRCCESGAKQIYLRPEVRSTIVPDPCLGLVRGSGAQPKVTTRARGPRNPTSWPTPKPPKTKVVSHERRRGAIGPFFGALEVLK